MAKTKKLPKRIGGVKIPKKLRKRGGALFDVINQPVVKTVATEMIAVGLLAAADALAQCKPAKNAGKKAKKAAAKAGGAAADTASDTVIDVGNVLAFAAR